MHLKSELREDEQKHYFSIGKLKQCMIWLLQDWRIFDGSKLYPQGPLSALVHVLHSLRQPV